MDISERSKYKNFLFYWLPILIYCIVIFIQSSYPSPEDVPDIPYFDKFLHFSAYALLGFLFVRAYRTLRIKDNLNLVIILSILSSSIYGISDELHQHYVPFRDADMMDAFMDMLGSIFGAWIYYLFMVKYRSYMLKIPGLTKLRTLYKNSAND